MNLDDLKSRENNINTKFFVEKLGLLEEDTHLINNVNVLSKKAIKLYNGLAFRQLKELDSTFYKDVIILSSLYGFSYGDDYISQHRLDYTSSIGRAFRKEMYQEINEMLSSEDRVYNLASNEYSKGIVHTNIIEFEFLVYKNGTYKNISAISKKLRGAMVDYIRCNGTTNINQFNQFDFEFCEEDSTENKLVFKCK